MTDEATEPQDLQELPALTPMARAIAREVAALMRVDQVAGDDLILNTSEAAEFIGVGTKTLENWRCAGEGPRFVKIGARAVGYRCGDLRTWVRERPSRGRRALEAIGMSPA